MITKEQLNNARAKMLEQKKILEEKRKLQKGQPLSIFQSEVKGKEVIETKQSEKKVRQLLTKTESISILITEAEMIKNLRARITDPKNDFYPSKSDIHRLGISLLESFKDEEVVEMIKSIKF